MNPLLFTDGYKTSHHQQYPDNTTLVYSNWTPRSNKYAPEGCDKVVVFGTQMAVRILHEVFQRDFFNKPKEEVCGEMKKELSLYLGYDYDVTHFEKLHDLGYLPIRVKSLTEGTLCPIKIPALTICNTHFDFYWITNYLETILSSLLWKPMTSATIAYQYKKILKDWALKTDKENVGFVDFQGHDFSMRGMDSISATERSGLGHLTSFLGTDSLPPIYAARKYYDEKGFVAASVPATEHSVMSAGYKEDEKATYERLLKIYPKGILSVVSDTWDLWNVITNILPKLKEQILGRDGKVVIRPDCLDDKSQILTPKGWKFFNDLTDDDLVAQVKEDGTYEFVKPLKVINEPYEGDMYEIRDFHGKIDLVVTPNHRLVSYKNSDNSVSIKEASEYNQNYWKYKKLRSPKSQSKGIELSPYDRFLIALQADGCIKYVNKDLSTRVEFNFQKERKHNRLLEILKNTDLEYNVYFSKSRKGQSTFSVLIPNDRIVSKTFDWVNTSNLDSLWCEQFIEELKYWDSTIKNDGRFIYSTTIEENINIVELVAISAGKGIYISKSEDIRKEHFSDVYTAHILDNPFIGGQSITKTKIYYKGTVHCVKVPTGMILVKRNQGVCVTGNSGNPVDIICGKIEPIDDEWYKEVQKRNYLWYDENDEYCSLQEYYDRVKGTLEYNESKGVIELLWDIFGGTINEQGYKVLDSHIGALYGDSITLERANEICRRLEAKGFASTNIVLGIGSFTYQYNTRDTFGFAMKATYVERLMVDNSSLEGIIKGQEIFKNPVTDDGTKKSATGLLCVQKNRKTGEYVLLDKVSWDQEIESELQTIYEDGDFQNQTTLTEIRQKLNNN